MSHISINNLFQHDFNAISFSLLGMTIVFSGLVIISLYISMLPAVLRWFAKKEDVIVEGSNKEKAVGDETFIEKERLIAIAVAYHLENSSSENDKITWVSKPDVESAWQISGRVHGLAARGKGLTGRIRQKRR
jgi:Na+-transporting methylmalonyl-CoA/oxaloacetate decarboxylase gamma subunit